MSPIARSVFVVAIGAALWLPTASAWKAQAGDPPPRTGEAAVEQALAKPVALDFDDEPLEDVVASLKEKCRIEIVLDVRAMADCGIEPDEPVTLRAGGVPLRAALNLILRPIDLRWTVRDGVLLITTPEEDEAALSVQAYDVADLVVCRDEDDEPWDDYETLAQLIVDAVRPDTWSCAGGYGTIAGAGVGTAKVLVVSQTHAVHGEIAGLLAKIRAIARKNPQAELPRRNRPAHPAEKSLTDCQPGSRGRWRG